MKSLLTVAGVGMLALLALAFVWRGEASANDGPFCAPTTGFIPQFCVNVPVGVSVRRETTVPLSTILTTGADVRVESGVPAAEVIRIAAGVDYAIARVERAFDRPFATKPRIFVFATHASFARGTQDLFGYSTETAASVAASYGGVFDPQTLTIAVGWQAATAANLPDLLAHELTHLAMREIVGHDAALPAWFEEGVAAEIQAGDAGIDQDAQLAARSLLANAPNTLDSITTLAEWHRAYAQMGAALYAVSAETVRKMAAQIGRDAMFALLTEVGRGARFEDAYQARAGETVDEFLKHFTDDLAFHPIAAVGTVPDTSGNLLWTLSGFAPNADVRISISGNSYDLAYTVRTDGIGLYRGTFGSTAALGAYTLTARVGALQATATIDTTSQAVPPRTAPQTIDRQEPVSVDASALRAYARKAATLQGINADLFVRQINQESSFDPNARSKAGAVGIAQIMPGMHPAVDATDPYASLDYAARLMRGYLTHFGSWRLALVAYNAGPGRITPGNPAFLPVSFILSNAFAGGETKRYVANILG